MTEWRVEELAQEADVSVDTIRFYQKRRLLPPPRREGRLGFYGPEHLDRLARIRDLRRRGLTLALIGRLVRGELDATDEPLAAAVLAADAEDAEEFLSIEELARRCNIPLVLLETVANEGLLVPRDHEGEPRYTAADVAVVTSGMRLVETGLPLDQLIALARAHHAATREIATQAVAMFDEHVRRPLREADLPDDEKAARLVDAFSVLLPSVTTLVAHHFRRVLLEVAQEHLEAVGNESEIAAANAAANRRLEGLWQG
ncbi:MAG TPA: MerR family transcriptional regulator [Acidimicrobiia bacterium]